MSMKITDKDTGFKELLRKVAEMKAAPGGKPHVRAGIFADSGNAEEGGVERRDSYRRDENGKFTGGRQKAKETHSSGLTVADVMLYNEFGTERIPERPVIRSTVTGARFHDLMAKLTWAMVLGKMGVMQALGILGEAVQSEMKRRIVDKEFEANKQSTIDRKGSSTPLIDTGQLKESLRYERVA